MLLAFSDYLRKIIVQGRSSKSTKVGDIMTEEVPLIPCSHFFRGCFDFLSAQYTLNKISTKTLVISM